jgi:hypothetical protein
LFGGGDTEILDENYESARALPVETGSQLQDPKMSEKDAARGQHSHSLGDEIPNYKYQTIWPQGASEMRSVTVLSPRSIELDNELKI